jgi:hypothetical protein
MRSLFNKSILVLLVSLSAYGAGAQRNGMYFDHRNNYLIPLQDHDALVGHAYVILADKISRDSNMYILGVYDQYLANVGERKFNVSSSFEFDCAAFDGKDIYARFIDDNKAVRYVVFNQSAAVIFDTTLAIKCRKAPADDVAYYQQASIFPLSKGGIIDNIFLSGKTPAAVTVRITPGGAVWTNARVSTGNASNRILFANEKLVVEAVYKYSDGGMSPTVGQTSIVTLDARNGEKLGETVLTGKTGQKTYPVSAVATDAGIEVLSEYTREAKKYGRIKYGVSIHRLNAGDAKVQGAPLYNEFTTTLLKDTGLEGRRLMTSSYLYVSHAARLANGHWLLAMQQFTKLPLSVHLFKNKAAYYHMKSICFVELNEEAKVLASHAEENMTNKVRVPAAFFANPQNSGVHLAAKSATDIGYFAAPDATNSQVSFVFTDLSDDRDLMVGNVLFRNGKFEVDKFTQGSGNYAYAGLLPARYGHTYLITFDAITGKFEFDNIKFNN